MPNNKGQCIVVVLRTIKNMFESRKGLVEDEYMDVMTSLIGKELPLSIEHISLRWKDDVEFARQASVKT